jgi:hypothetical protein
MSRIAALGLAIATLASPLIARAADDQPANGGSSLSEKAKAFGLALTTAAKQGIEQVKAGAQAAAAAAKGATHKAAGTTKEGADQVAATTKEGVDRVGASTKAGADSVAGAAKRGARKTKAADGPNLLDKTADSADKPAASTDKLGSMPSN